MNAAFAWSGPGSRSGLLPGQPGVLVLDQLEQGGLDLFDLWNLGEDELPVLAGRFDHELAAAAAGRSARARTRRR